MGDVVTTPKNAESRARCALPRCDEPMNRWPGRCRRVAGHGGDFHGPPNPFIPGPPFRNARRCHTCGHEVLADEPVRRVRVGWLRRAWVHDA